MSDDVEKRIDWKLLAMVAITAAGWVYTAGVSQQRISDLDRRVEKTEALIGNIDRRTADINVQTSLISSKVQWIETELRDKKRAQ